MSYFDVSDCIAASEDQDWWAFPKSMRRGQVMAALARESDWWTVIHETRIHAGYVVERDVDTEGGWWEECREGTPNAVPCWIATRD
jgi:hypothetical protein